MRKRRRYRIRFWGLIAVLILIPIISLRACKLHKDRYTTMVYGVPVHTVLVSENSPSRPGTVRDIKYIVLHETGNFARGSDAASHSHYLRYTNTTTTSWHYTVDDHEIYHHIPDHEVAWHASDKLNNPGGNLNGIGVELCVNEDGDFEKTFDNAARLVAHLLKEYDLTLDDVKQHADFADKNCPESIRDNDRMDEFKNLVSKYINEEA